MGIVVLTQHVLLAAFSRLFSENDCQKAILLSVLLSIFAGYLPFINQVLTLQRTFCLSTIFYHRFLFSLK